MHGLLQGKSAIITGCNRGIGKAMLEVFAKNGANIWACARKEEAGFADFVATLARQTGVKIMPVYFDLADSEQVKAAVAAIKNSQMPVDILVNNAGIIFTALFQMTPIEKMKEIFETNFFAQMLFSQYISKIMTRQKKGCIINFSSSAGIEGNEGRVAYAASKAAIINVTKVMARELAVNNIRVNAIAPGLTQTEMMASSTPADALVQTLQRICMKRVGQPEEIANAALFLASDLASYVTGQVLRVDGGMLA